MRIWIFSLCLLFVSASGLGQSTSSEPEGMQALVAEVRLLRMDLQATNGNALKAQILLQRLQLQETAVARVSERLSTARARLADMQRHRAEVAGTLKRFEETLENTDTSEDRKRFQAEISARKQELEAIAPEEQQRQAAEMEAEEQLRTEQAKVRELEERVDRLEKNLDNPHQ